MPDQPPLTESSALSMNLVKFILLASVACYLGLAVFAALFANRMIFPQPPSSYSDSEAIIKIPYGSDGYEVSALFLPNEDADRIVFYHHGNGEDLGRIQGRLQLLREQGFAVFAWDYPGYGTSTGRPNEARVMQAARAGMQFIVNELGFSEEQVILYGRSLGGGPAVQLAVDHAVAGLILEGTFTSAFRVLTRVRILPWDVFDNLSRIDQIDAPLLIIHGNHDYTVPYSHAHQLYRRASEPKTFVTVDTGGHNNLVEDFADIYWEAIHSFIQSL